jgi:hypothetical protein
MKFGTGTGRILKFDVLIWDDIHISNSIWMFQN